MGRSSERKQEIEAVRLELLHAEQKKMRKRLQRELKVKKKTPHLPGQEIHRKHLAVLLKMATPNITYGEIASRINETRATVRKWFKEDPEVKDFYEEVVSNLKEGSLELMKTYSLEAVEVLAILMRWGSEKYMFESACQILDRVGVPKVERREIESENIKSHKWSDRDALVAEIRELDPEQQEQAVEALEKFEQLLSEHSSNGNKPDDDSGLEPISRVETDEEEDDEDE